MLHAKKAPVDSRAVTRCWVSGVPQCEHIVLAVVVIIVPAFVVVMRPAVLWILSPLLVLPDVGLP